MKSLLLALLVVSTSCTSNPKATAQYRSVREGYRRSLIAREARHEDVRPAELSALADLERRLRPIIGEFHAPFVAGNGRINLETLRPGDEASGLPDGILYTSADSSIRVLVSTDSLIGYWVSSLGVIRSEPRNVRVALSNPDVLNQVFPIDAAVNKYRDIPVKHANHGFATAMLVKRAQDYCDCEPDEVFVSAIRGHRVFIIDAPARDTLQRPAVCVAEAKANAAASKTLFDRALASSPRDTALMRKASALDSVSDVAFRRCYGEHATNDPRFQRIVDQVAEILVALPSR